MRFFEIIKGCEYSISITLRIRIMTFISSKIKKKYVTLNFLMQNPFFILCICTFLNIQHLFEFCSLSLIYCEVKLLSVMTFVF